MLIIIEGPKCCGKTTLCNRLACRYGAEIIHFPTNSDIGKRAMELLNIPDRYDECQDLMEQDINQKLATLDSKRLYILDRSFISNSIYRSDPKPQLGRPSEIILKDKYIDILKKSMLIILLASDENLHKWIKLRTEKPLNQTELSKLSWSNERFHRLASILECRNLGTKGSQIVLQPGYFVLHREGY